MKKDFSVLMVVTAVLFLFAFSGVALAITQAERDALRAEMAALTQEKQGIDNEQLDINKKFDDAKWVEGQLKKLDAQLKSDKTKIQNDITRFSMDASQYDRGVAQHNAQCGGKVFKLPDEQAAYNSCQNNKAYYDREKTRLEAEQARLRSTAKAYDESYALFRQNVDLWVSNLNKLDARQNRLDDRKRNWLIRYNVLLNSKAFQQLVAKEAKSDECKNIPGIENLELDVLDGAAERAHRCLQQVWDGAK